ncbi:hypothetical protein QCA50_020354 [Cerrena zonata]|uniref:C2 domain-containing protein n=1 Tax=Cerrena zonata TaxID=2478898 RepID=A0AAW0FAI2_9APHY
MARNIHLTIRSARNIEWFGEGCYPTHTPPKLYITLKVNSHRDRTEMKDEVDPQWNQEFTLPALEDDHVIRFRLKSAAIVFRDRIIGEIECKVADLLTPESPKELQIFGVGNKMKSSTTGMIVVSVEAINVDDAAKRLLREAQAAPATDDIARKVNELNERLKLLKIVINAIDQLAKLNSKVELAWYICSALYRVVDHQCSTDQRVISLIDTMIRTLDFAQDSRKLNEYVSSLETTITNLVTQVAECAIFVREYFRPSFLARLTGQLLIDSNKKIEDLIMTLTSLRASLESKIPLHVGTKILEGQVEAELVSAKIFMNVSNLRESDALRELHPALMNVGTRPLCLRGTREATLAKIMNWVLDVDNAQQSILWLHGLAGSGKSTIARTVAARLDGLGRRGAFLFFERGKTSPDTVVQTLAVQLANSDPLLKSRICEAIEKNHNIVTVGLDAQFDSLLRGPLTKAAESLYGPIVIVLDALDEYGDTSSRNSLLKLISNELPKLPNIFRFLITSRPESDIVESFSRNLMIRQMSLKDMGDAAPAIRIYLSVELAGILGSESDAILNARPPSASKRQKETNLDRLVNMSEGLFIWASTLIGYIRDNAEPAGELESILHSKSEEHSRGLDGLYETVLSARKGWDGLLRERFCSIMSIILFCSEPLSDVDIDQMLDLPRQKGCRALFEAFHCLFDYKPNNPIRPLHVSFRDYLTDEMRSEGKPWSLAGFDADHHLAMCCFRVMSKQLYFNICNFKTSDCQNKDYPDLNKQIEKNISPVLMYASGHWAEHLVQVKCSTADIQRALESFSNKQVFFWLEVASLVCDYNIIERFCKDVIKFLQGEHNVEKLVSLWSSALEFWGHYQNIVKEYTPHLYVSGFTYPEDSPFISTYASLFTTARIIIGQDKDTVQVLEEDVFEKGNPYGHSGKNTCVSFSPDGTKFLVSSKDGSIYVRNSSNYTLIKEFWPLKYTSLVVQALFSANSQHIYAALEDGTIHSSSGAILYKSNTDMGRVYSMSLNILSSEEHIYVLYENGALVVSSDGVLIHKPYIFPDMCSFGSISSKGIMACVKNSGSLKKPEIWFWSLTENTTSLVQTTYNRVDSIAFTPDGDKVALFVEDFDHYMKICLWDVNTKEPLQNGATRVSLLHKYHACAISPDLSLVAVAHNSWLLGNANILIFSLKSGDLVQDIYHSGTIDSLFFPSDSQKLVVINGMFQSYLEIIDLSIISPMIYNVSPCWGGSILEPHKGVWIGRDNQDKELFIPKAIWSSLTPPGCNHIPPKKWRLNFGVGEFFNGENWAKGYNPEWESNSDIL